MSKHHCKTWIVAAIHVAALTSIQGAAMAQPANENSAETAVGGENLPTDRYRTSAVKHVSDAAAVVRRMESVPRMKTMLQQSKGVFIVPTYGRAALAVGGKGGAGVLLVKRDDGSWSDPVFYNISGISLGLQAGVEGGPIAMVLNNDKAVNRFMQKNNFSLSADSGITIVNWAKMAEGSTGSGDVVAWAGTKGIFGDVITIGVNDIRLNQNLTNAYYDRTLSANDVIAGKVKNPQANMLKQELASMSTGSSSAGSQGNTGSAGAPGNAK